MDTFEDLSGRIVRYGTNTSNIPLHSLNVLYMNIRSCRNKLDMIEGLIASLGKKIHIIVFTETWLYQNEIFNLFGYKSFHCVRDKDRGGGVSIFIDDNISAHELHTELHVLSNSNFLVLDLPEYKNKLIGVYNPGGNSPTFLSRYDEIIAMFPSSMIFGDFNINLIDTHEALVTNYRSIVEGNGFMFLNPLDEAYATRESNTVKTVIDHISTDLCDYKYHFTLLESDPDLSDHKTIILSIDLLKQQTMKLRTKTVLQYERIDENLLVTDQVITFADFSQRLSAVVSENTKVVRVCDKTNVKKPYINAEILKMIETKRNLYFAFKRNPALGPEYRRKRNELTNKIKLLKRNHIDSKVNNNLGNPKQMWNNLNQLIFNRQSHAENSFAININGSLCTDEAIISNCFNDYYINVCDSVIQNWSNNQIITTSRFNELFDFHSVTESNVLANIKSLNPNSATGVDGISTKFLKRFSNSYLSKYTFLINQCIAAASFPDVLKTARVIPIYKSGNKTLTSNYRPISVLNAISKPFEKCLYQQIQEYCIQHSAIHKDQFGFVPKSNTMTAVSNLVNDIYVGLDNRKKVACLFIDVRKAFDCVHHDLLVNKLRRSGFSINACKLIKSYLSNRTQVVRINGKSSSPRVIKYGVPQGSILGPLLFILFVNDIFRLPLKGKLQLYADDASLLYTEENFETLRNNIEHDIKLLTEYFMRNHMAINLDKTNYIVFSLRGKPQSIPINVNGTEIKQINSARYLGVIIDENLRWNLHTELVRSKISPYIFALRKLRHFISEKTAWKIYFAYIYPHLVYMNSIWGSAAEIHLQCIRTLQNKSIKIIKRLPILFPTNQLYNSHTLPLSLLNKYEICLFIYKIANNLIKTNLELTLVSNIHDRITRSVANNNLYPVRCRTTLAQNGIMSRGILLYNMLPMDIRNTVNIIIFKQKLRSYLIRNH